MPRMTFPALCQTYGIYIYMCNMSCIKVSQTADDVSIVRGHLHLANSYLVEPVRLEPKPTKIFEFVSTRVSSINMVDETFE